MALFQRKYIDVMQTKTNLTSDLDDATTEEIQNFWTDRPMIHPGFGFDIDKASPEGVFEHMEKIMRDKAALMQSEGGPLMENYIDYEWLKGKTALEIGYGTGWLMNELAKVCKRAEGIDLSKSHYALSSYRFKDQANVNLQIASAQEIPFEDNTFDFVASYGVLHHAESDIECYDEVYRVLKPGGRCFLMLYRAGGPKFWWQKLFRKGILKGGLKKHGWDVTRFIYSVTDKYQDDSPGAPISRHYKRKELQKILSKFSDIDIKISGNVKEWDDLPFERLPLSNILPKAMRRKLVTMSGAYWMVTLTK